MKSFKQLILVIRVVLSFTFAIFITACGGGSDGGDTTPPASDTTAPVITLAASSTAVYSGDVVTLTITITDNVSTNITVTETCTAGDYTNNTLTLPAVETETIVTCTVNATDEAGNQAIASIDITVTPNSIQLTDLLETSEVRAGSMLALTSSTYDFSFLEVTGVIDGKEITLKGDSEGVFNFIVPVINEGEHTLEIAIGEKTATFAFTVLAPLFDSTVAESYVTNAVTTQLQAFEAHLVANGGNLSQEESDFYNNYINQYNALTAEQISSVTQEEWVLIGSIISTNLTLTDNFVTNSAKSYVQSFDEEECPRSLVVKHYFRGGAKFIIGAGLISLAPGASLTVVGGVFVGITSVAIFHSGLESLAKAKEEAINCTFPGARTIAQIISSNNVVSSKKQQSVVMQANADFAHNDERSFEFTANYSIEEDVLAELASPINKLNDIILQLTNYLPNVIISKVEDAVAATEPYEAVATNENLTLSQGNNNVDLQINFTGETQIGLTASIIDFSTSSNENFTLKILDIPLGETTEVASAVSIGPPVAYDSYFTVLNTELLSNTVAAQYAGTYEIVNNPVYGILTSFDPTNGAFVFDPNDDYEGEDSFTFKAINGAGESNIITVTIDIVECLEECGFIKVALNGNLVENGKLHPFSLWNNINKINTHTFTITNPYNVPVVMSEILATGSIEINAALPLTLQPEESQTFGIEFYPTQSTSRGPETLSLKDENDDLLFSASIFMDIDEFSGDWVWTWTDSSVSGDCELNSTVNTAIVNRTNTGETLQDHVWQISTSSGFSASGLQTASGNQLVVPFSRSYSEDDGTTTSTGTINITKIATSGNSSWTWTDGEYNCSGTSVLRGGRN